MPDPTPTAAPLPASQEDALALWLTQARLAVQQQRWGLADRLAVGILTIDPSCAQGWEVLATLAQRIGRADRARVWRARAGLPAGEVAAPASAEPSSLPRILLSREWGEGFWSDVEGVLTDMLVSEVTQRQPAVWWGGHSRFTDNSSRNAWESFFQPIGAAHVEALLREKPSDDDLPAKWKGHHPLGLMPNQRSGPGSCVASYDLYAEPARIAISDFHSNVNVVLPWLPESHRLAGKTNLEAMRDLCKRYLVPQPAIARAARAFFDKFLAKGRSVAVHIRGSDKVGEVPGLERLPEMMFDVIARELSQSPATRVFLMTDSLPVALAATQRFGPRLVVPNSVRSQTDQGVHFIKPAAQLGHEVLGESLVATHCHAFCGLGPSNVSAMIEAMKPWPAGSCTNIPPSIRDAINPVPFGLPAPLPPVFGPAMRWPVR